MEYEVGNMSSARAALAQAQRGTIIAAVVLARLGDAPAAEAIIKHADQQRPSGTLRQKLEIPLVRAAMALHRGDALKTIETLRPAADVEWGGERSWPVFEVPYVRGYAYLAAGDVTDAAAEFHKILDHRGVAPVSPLYPLAYVGLGRSYAKAGEVMKSQAAYEQFFTIWKDADPDVPILLAARREYAKLAGKRK